MFIFYKTHLSLEASLLTALAPPGLNFTRVYISDAKARTPRKPRKPRNGKPKWRITSARHRS